jgi:hypothetical protein
MAYIIMPDAKLSLKNYLHFKTAYFIVHDAKLDLKNLDLLKNCLFLKA